MPRRGTKARLAHEKAKDLIARLEQPAFREAVQFTEQDLKALDQITSGKPPRNAWAIISGLRLKAEFAYARPKQEIEVSGSLEIVDRLRRGLKRAGK